MKTLFCYGDSNTYGYDPRSFWEDRYEETVRWPERLAAKTGYTVLNRGENGRCIPTTALEYRLLDRSLAEAGPLWAVTLMLGTNDLLLGKSPANAARDLEALVIHLQETCPAARLILLSPPALRLPEPALVQAAGELTALCQALAGRYALPFLGLQRLPLACDGVHLSEEGHRLLADMLVLTLKAL